MVPRPEEISYGWWKLVCVEIKNSIHRDIFICRMLKQQNEKSSQKWVPLCCTVCCNDFTSCNTILLKCVYTLGHVYMSTWPPMPPQSPLHSNKETWVAVCLCCSHLISVPTPCLECVHVLVHVFMPTGFSMCAPPHAQLLCKAVLTLVHNCYLFLYMKWLGGLHYNSLYALSLHSTTSSSSGSLFFAC